MRRRFFFFQNLGLQLLALYLLLIIPFLLTLVIFDGLIGQRIRSEVEASDLSLAQAIAQQTDLSIGGALEMVKGLATYPAVIAADPAGMEPLFRLILDTRNDVNLVYRLDKKGIMLYHYPARPGSVDLMILDLMMPHLDGLETIQRIRQVSQVPIIILTALDEEKMKVQAFDLGADDYLTKPFGVGELLGRVKAVLRRSRWNETSLPGEQLRQGEIRVDLERHEVYVGERKIDLTPIEFNLLIYLMQRAGKVLSHREICSFAKIMR
jgi:CheY-like chemotaxis protein